MTCRPRGRLWRMRRTGLATGVLLASLAAIGCERAKYDPHRATRPYPYDLHRAESIDLQVFRDGQHIQIVNSTPKTYQGTDVWVNQRYVLHLGTLPAGATVDLPLWEFRDVRGDPFPAGGLLRTTEDVPVRLVEFQTAEDELLIGVVAIPGSVGGR